MNITSNNVVKQRGGSFLCDAMTNELGDPSTNVNRDNPVQRARPVRDRDSCQEGNDELRSVKELIVIVSLSQTKEWTNAYTSNRLHEGVIADVEDPDECG